MSTSPGRPLLLTDTDSDETISESSGREYSPPRYAHRDQRCSHRALFHRQKLDQIKTKKRVKISGKHQHDHVASDKEPAPFRRSRRAGAQHVADDPISLDLLDVYELPPTLALPKPLKSGGDVQRKTTLLTFDRGALYSLQVGQSGSSRLQTNLHPDAANLSLDTNSQSGSLELFEDEPKSIRPTRMPVTVIPAANDISDYESSEESCQSMNENEPSPNWMLPRPNWRNEGYTGRFHAAHNPNISMPSIEN